MRIPSSIRSLRSLFFAPWFALVVLAMSASSFAQIDVAITIGPPALPAYEQPLCPGDGYLWTPGYWAYDYDASDYYWVPGTWVTAPEVGFLWTPAYWGWGGDGFVFYDGYWGQQVGFYGGINYGFGYGGEGYEGGRWDNGHFFYNRSVNNVNITEIHNVYDRAVTNTTMNRVSYNGGNGGIIARPSVQDEAAGRERHIPPVTAQTQHAQAARANPQQRASANMGKPGVAATPRPGDFNDRRAVPAREAGAPYSPGTRAANQVHTQSNSPQPVAAVHPRDLPAYTPTAPNTGRPKLDKKYQQQQDKQVANQQVERDKLQQKQDEEHQQLANQHASEPQKQQVEQQHQQQTDQLQQKHQQQQQQLQQKQQPETREQPKH
jgi:hypothetical protein